MSIVIKSLSKTFDNKDIFINFSYTFPDTGVFALFGESGIGKTTLLRMISGLDKSYEGTIEIQGAKSVSYAFQEHRLFPNLTALENVYYANFNKKNEAELNICKKILFSLGFTEYDIELYPRELSGGMRQRVSLARAFLNHAKILLLDEPTKELDEENCAKVTRMIKEEAKSRLIILVTHKLSDIESTGAEVINLSH